LILVAYRHGLSLALAVPASAASTFATLLTFSVALAITQQFGTTEEARAMLDRVAAALKGDEAKALRDFNDTNNKLFHDRDLYISCFNTSDGKFTAFPGPGMRRASLAWGYRLSFEPGIVRCTPTRS
jgi:hypothetical protein